MIQWRIGCSGFYYKHWKEIFYPKGLPQNKWFTFYCEHFNTLELNVTFYRFPQLSFLQSWYERSSATFNFAIKAPRGITHYKKFIGTEKLIDDFYSTIAEGLREKLGCILFQLPPSYNYTDERLQNIISSLDHSFNNVIEFRHTTWWNKVVYDELAKKRITFCGMSHLLLPDEIIQNTQIVYHRMHGVPELYKSPYSIVELKKIIEVIKNSGSTNHAFIYFNNDIHGSAITNAKQMIELCEKKR
ncbi:MAG: DUF72 domain-containing protein [Chitinophagaceae bacterium]|nr:DUF72 domain-containing protein [Chitinophagaceae bacterium]